MPRLAIFCVTASILAMVALAALFGRDAGEDRADERSYGDWPAMPGRAG